MKKGIAFLLILLMNSSMYFGSSTSSSSIYVGNIASSQYMNMVTPSIKEGGVMMEGTVGDLYPGSAPENCADASLTYVGCNGWLEHRPQNGNFHGTTVIIDAPLSAQQYYQIERDNINVDIIKYLVPTSTRNVSVIGNPGKDPLYSDSQLKWFNETHGIEVLSAFAEIAQSAKVIYIPMDFVSKGYAFTDIVQDTTIWKWLRDNVDTYDIDVISMSWNIFTKTPYSAVSSIGVSSVIDELYNKGVFMVTAMGNAGEYTGNYFPQNHEHVYGVGSVDHESRGEYFTTGYVHHFLGFSWTTYSTTYDPDYYSRMGSPSGDAVGSPLKTSYGTSNPGPSATDFAMPGNGVPVREPYVTVYRYGMGTSYSTPYFAAAVLVGIHAFNLGHLHTGYVYKDPSVDKLYQLLKEAASGGGNFNYKLGYGSINLLDLYDGAYNAGWFVGAGGSLSGSSSGGVNCIPGYPC